MFHLTLLMAITILPNNDPRTRVLWDTTYERTLTGDWKGLFLRISNGSPAMCYWHAAPTGLFCVEEGGPLPTLYPIDVIKLYDGGKADVILWGARTHRAIYKTFGERIWISFDEDDKTHRPASFFDPKTALLVLWPDTQGEKSSKTK